MNPETFFDNFGMLADVPDGVSKLRELILQLAVQGKLVAQDENDEPAEVLLGRIKEEKKSLLKAGKIKKSKPLSLNDIKNPYELPANWKWTRLFDIGIINPRNEAEDDVDSSFIPMKLISETYKTPISSEKRKWGEIKSGFTHFAEEDVVLAKITPCFQNGKSAIIRNLSNGIGAGTTELHVYRPLLEESVNPDYVLLYLRTPKFLTEGIEKMTGTAGQKRVPRDYFAGNPFPLPPFEEQKRIVAKVDQLMTLCDQLEARQKKKHEARTRLNSAALFKLTSVPDGFMKNWQNINDNFGLLYDAPETVGELRKAILQLAVMGKLVAQDPNSESAAELLNKLRKDRNKWLKDNSNKNSECKTALKKLKKLQIPNNPFTIPKSWQFVNLIDCCRLLIDCHNKTAPYSQNGIPLIRTTNIRDRQFRMTDLNFVTEETYQFWSRRCPPEPDDIIFTREAPMGEAAIIPEGVKYCLGQRTMLIRPMHKYILNSYLLITLTEPQLLKRASSSAIGSTVKHLRVGDVERLTISIPPFEEQRRIVARVDQLMTLCDELEAKLAQSQKDGAELMEAVVGEMVAG